jgi:GNAT superfamily N-acetyltransferase
MHDLRIDTDPAAADIAQLDDNLYAFNVAATGLDDGVLLAIFLRDENGDLRAGLSGHTWGGVCKIKLLWIREDERGRGLGAQLMAAAEEEALRRGCTQAVLSTHSFQAPDFYRRLGYKEAGFIADYPKGHQQIFFVKALASPAA